MAATPEPLPTRTTQVLWTDGGCENNGFPNAIAGIGVYFGPADPRNVAAPLHGTKQTSQRAELAAAIVALARADYSADLCVITDSTYVARGVAEWLPNWQKNGWLTSTRSPVENQDLWQKLVAEMSKRSARALTTRFRWVKGHGTNVGNIAADKLAEDGVKIAQFQRSQAITPASGELRQEMAKTTARREIVEKSALPKDRAQIALKAPKQRSSNSLLKPTHRVSPY
jgi:ribonuclease HI